MTIEQINAVTAETKQAWRQMFSATEDLNKYLSAAKAGKLDVSNLKNLKRTVDSVAPELPKLSKTNKIVDALKRGAFKEINPSWGSRLSNFLAVLQAGFITFLIKKNEEIQELNIQSQKATEAGLADTFTRTINNSIHIKGIDARVEQLKLNDQRTRDRVYGLERQNVGINDNIDKAKKNANDALYEVRKGREIVEKKINDNLYEFRKTRDRIDADFNKIKSDFNKYLQSVGSGAKISLQDTVTTIQKSLNTTTETVAAQGKLINNVQSTVKDIQATITALPKTVNTQVTDLKDFVIKLVNDKTRSLEIKQQAQETVNKTFVERKELTGVTTSLKATYDLSFEAQAAKFNEQFRAQQGDINAIKSVTVSSDFKSTTVDLTRQVTQLRTDIETTKTDIRNTKTDITKIGDRLREQERVNQEGNRKLDQILPAVSALPAVFGRAEQNIINKLPTPEDLANAAATGVCRSTKPGGCMNKALGDAASDIKTNANNNAGALLDAYNAGANTALLAGQAEILSRIGAQLPGGIGGKLSRIGEWLHLDRVLNLMILGSTIHNALMLSNDLGQTLLGIVNNVLTLFGLKKEDGSPFDIGSVVSGTIENLIKGVIGEDNYTGLREGWAKANRIYQATTNVLNSFLNLSQTILQASELIAAYTGKIGNALKKGGVILENAYGWMNPQPKFNRVTNFLETLQNGANTIQMVTQTPLDVVNAVTDSTTAATEFVKAFKEDDKAENKAVPIPEPDQLKAQETQAKNNSQPNPFDFSDLFDGED